jgi:tetratricopeptide (TPR) repeat protein
MTHIITTIPVKQFANLFRTIDKDSPDSKFCFILGAGASSGSGIKTGGEMAKEWFADIESLKYFSKEDVSAWMTEEKIDKDRLAEFYGPIYKKRFSQFKSVGYDYLVNEMNNSEPSFGYSVLSQLLTMTRHKVVITTNFDSLVESALYSFTNVRPVVVGHESLAAFARPRAKEPLIAKIHRDLLYNPLNEKEETDVMASPWTSVLEHIFRTHVPVVIGYGGNDGSLMNYLMKIPPCHGMFWCLFGKEEPREDIMKVVEHHCGHFVRMDGFDELMFDIMQAMEYKLIDDIFTNTAERRKREYQEQVKTIQEKKKRSDDPLDKKAAAHLSEKARKNDWWSWQLMIDGTEDNDEKERIYTEGIEKTAHPYLISNYAIFLKDIRKDFDKAEQYYLKTLEAEPDDANFIGNYAMFIDDVRKDFDQAEQHYLKALEAEPDNAMNNGNYAAFLKFVRKDFEKAEQHYLKALEAEPDHSNNNGNYAVFLKDVRKDFDKAEQHYLKALEAEPDDADFNGNYAQMLLASGRKEEGTPCLEKAFKNCDNDALELELWFYRYAHYEEQRDYAHQEIEQLLSKGVRSVGWDFTANIERAIADGHPDPEELKRLAAAISNEV